MVTTRELCHVLLPRACWRGLYSLGVAIAGISWAVPAFAQYTPPKQMTLTSTGVNLGDGRFVYNVTDLSIGPLALERSHHGGQMKYPSKMFGPGWTHNYDIYITEGDGQHLGDTNVILGRTSATFSRYGFTDNFDAYSPEDLGSKLTVVGGAFVYRTKLGDVYTFNPSVMADNVSGRRDQRVSNIVYADGRRLDFYYNGQYLTQIRSNLGYAFVFENNGSGYVTKACAFNLAQSYIANSASVTCSGAQMVTQYAYNSASLLGSVTDVMNQSWGYSYNNGGIYSVGCVMQVNSSACQLTNVFGTTGKPSQVGQQTTADGSVYDYYWANADPDAPHLPGQTPELTSMVEEGPEKLEIQASFYGGLLDTFWQNGRATQFEWDGILLWKLHYPEGNYEEKTFGPNTTDGGDIWHPKTGSATVSRTSSYAACTTANFKHCNKPETVGDYNGNQKTLTYSDDHGGVLTETGPAVAGITPQTRYTYTPTPRYAWIKTSSGGYTQAAAPIYLLTQKSTCLKGAPAWSGTGCALAGDEIKTTYDYGPDSGPNNLLLRGETVEAGGEVHRTCYGYDWQGNRISTTLPRANLVSCP